MIPAADILTLVSALRSAVTNEEAFGLIVGAIEDGLGWREAAAAWHDWRALQDASVKRIGGAA